MLCADPWIEGGWVTIVTGRGTYANHGECIKELKNLECLGIVAQHYSQEDSGALFVQLARPLSVPQVCIAQYTVLLF